jgi:hypothetical protein
VLDIRMLSTLFRVRLRGTTHTMGIIIRWKIPIMPTLRPGTLTIRSRETSHLVRMI